MLAGGFTRRTGGLQGPEASPPIRPHRGTAAPRPWPPHADHQPPRRSASPWHRSHPPPVGLNSPGCHLNPHTEGISCANVTVSFHHAPKQAGAALCEGFEAPSHPRISSPNALIQTHFGTCPFPTPCARNGDRRGYGYPHRVELNACTKGQQSSEASSRLVLRPPPSPGTTSWQRGPRTGAQHLRPGAEGGSQQAEGRAGQAPPKEASTRPAPTSPLASSTPRHLLSLRGHNQLSEETW